MMNREEFERELYNEVERILKKKGLDMNLSFSYGAAYHGSKLKAVSVLMIYPKKEHVEQDEIAAIALDQAYMFYKKINDLHIIAEGLVHDAEEVTACKTLGIPKEKYLEHKVANRVFPVLLKKSLVESVLQNIPHRDFYDMVVIYHVRKMAEEKDAPFSSVLTNEELGYMCISEPELYEIAVNNAKRIFTSEMKNLKDVFVEKQMKDGVSKRKAEKEAKTICIGDSDIYCCAYSDCMFGAALLLDNEFLYRLSQKVGGDLYIMPTSIFELQVVKAEGSDIDELVETLEYFNEECTQEEHRLTDSVYYFSQKDKKLYYGAAGKSGNDMGSFSMGVRITNGDIKFD